MQEQLIEAVCDLFPHVDRESAIRVVFGPARTDDGGLAYLAEHKRMVAALYSGLPSTTWVNSSRFIYAVAQALGNLNRRSATEALRGNLAVKLSTGDDSLCIFRAEVGAVVGRH